MENILQIPEWLATAMLAAVIAALGYVSKLLIESVKNAHDERNARRARLVELRSLLKASRISFEVQNQHSKHLLSMIKANHPDLIGEEDGFDRAFSKVHQAFTPEEKELHAIIRSITVYSLRTTNQSMSNWLKEDTYFKAQKPSKKILGELSEKLSVLECHLILWHAKYEIWISDFPEHALVYLFDEEEHGIRFPSGIDEIVQNIFF